MNIGNTCVWRLQWRWLWERKVVYQLFLNSSTPGSDHYLRDSWNHQRYNSGNKHGGTERELENQNRKKLTKTHHFHKPKPQMKKNPQKSRYFYNKTTKIHLNPHAIGVRGEKVYGTDTPRFTKCHSRLAWRTEFRVTQKFGFTLAVNGCLLRHVAGKQSHVNVVNPRRRKSRCLSKLAKKKRKKEKR